MVFPWSLLSGDGDPGMNRAGCRYGFLCCTSSPCCCFCRGPRTVSVFPCASLRASRGQRRGPCDGQDGRSDAERGGSPRCRSRVAHQHTSLEVHAAGGLRGKIQPGRFGSGSLPGDVIFRKQSRERLAHRLLAAERHHATRSGAVFARTSQAIFGSRGFRDVRELQDVRSGEVERSPATLWSRLDNFLPDWLRW